CAAAARARQWHAPYRHLGRAYLRPTVVRAVVDRGARGGQQPGAAPAARRQPPGHGGASLVAGGAGRRRPTPLRAIALGLVLSLAACGQGNVPHNTGLYLLVDTSGTYNRQVRKAEQIILVALSRLQPADSFAVARIDTASFTEKNIIAKATF